MNTKLKVHAWSPPNHGQLQTTQFLFLNISPAMSQRFQLRIATEDDFPEIYSKLWESFENPFQGVLRLFFPILDNNREASIQTCIAGQLEEYRQLQPTVTWVKIVDTQDGDKLAAAAKWYFYKENPHTGPQVGQLVADWYPEGIGREFATLAARQFERPREQMAQRPHACELLAPIYDSSTKGEIC
jgi:hypothetical protein